MFLKTLFATQKQKTNQSTKKLKNVGERKTKIMNEMRYNLPKS